MDILAGFFSLFFVFFVIFYLFSKISSVDNKNRTDNDDFQERTFSRQHEIGLRGESAVSSVLAEYCSQSKSHCFNNVTLPFDDGTTQIDHILLTRKGILVIETKNWSGDIYGKQEDAKWTQILSSSKNIYQNPTRQNYKHWLAICSLLNFIPQCRIQEVVVFTGKAVFETGIPDGVLFINELEDFLELFDFGIISDDDIHRSVGRIECTRLERSEQTDLDHQDYLNRTFGSQTFHNNYSYRKKCKFYSKDYQ